MSQIYYYALEGSRYLLADERNKKHLIDGLLSAHESKDWPVYAFCVTDESAYVIARTGRAGGIERVIGRAARQFLQGYEGFSGEGRCLRVNAVEAVDSETELARRCRAVHRLPLTLGYVSRIGDYWWSSYRNYVNGQGWRMVNCRPLLDYFSDDPDEAVRKLRLYHTDTGVRRNSRQHPGKIAPDPTFIRQ